MPNYLYLLVRNDMASLGRGKSIAQGAHAANAFTWDSIVAPAIAGQPIDPEALAWSQEAKTREGMPMGFGTTISLSASLTQIQNKVKIAEALGFKAKVVDDPEYPLVDGKTFHLLPHVVTGAYVFGDKETLSIVLGDLSLVPNDSL